MALTEDEIDLYSRQILVPAMGGRGQDLLAASSVQIIGAGAAPAFAASYLAGAGVGRIVWVSSDGVSPETALAPLDQRRPDTSRVERVGAAATGLRFDLIITASEPSARVGIRAAAALAPTAPPQPDTERGRGGAPALVGEIGLLRGDPTGLLLVPARSGLCLACLDWPDDVSESARTKPRTAAQRALEDPLVGAMAALTALVWLARLGPADEGDQARALLLENEEWRSAVPRRHSGPCPRCASRAVEPK